MGKCSNCESVPEMCHSECAPPSQGLIDCEPEEFFGEYDIARAAYDLYPFMTARALRQVVRVAEEAAQEQGLRIINAEAYLLAAATEEV